MTMLYTKLERSFNAQELHQMLSTTLQSSAAREEEERGFRRIERPPMPPGSSVFEQAKGELEIERQSERNGTASLPCPPRGSERGHSGRSRLKVPLSSPVPPSRGGRLSPVPPRRGGNLSRHNSARRSPSPFAQLTPSQQSPSGRLSPFLQVPSVSRPSSSRSRRSDSGSRSVSPR